MPDFLSYGRLSGTLSALLSSLLRSSRAQLLTHGRSCLSPRPLWPHLFRLSTLRPSLQRQLGHHRCDSWLFLFYGSKFHAGLAANSLPAFRLNGYSRGSFPRVQCCLSGSSRSIIAFSHPLLPPRSLPHSFVRQLATRVHGYVSQRSRRPRFLQASISLRFAEASHVSSVLVKVPIYPCLLVFEAL